MCGQCPSAGRTAWPHSSVLLTWASPPDVSALYSRCGVHSGPRAARPQHTRPRCYCLAAHEFKHALADVEEDVNAVARQLEDLEQHTSQAISLLVRVARAEFLSAHTHRPVYLPSSLQVTQETQLCLHRSAMRRSYLATARACTRATGRASCTLRHI